MSSTDEKCPQINENEVNENKEDTTQNKEDTTQKNNNFNLEDELNNINDSSDISDLLKNLGNDENISGLFKQFTSGFSNLNSASPGNINDFLNNDDDDDDDMDLDGVNLDKYFIAKNGDNICDILNSLKDELVKFNNK